MVVLDNNELNSNGYPHIFEVYASKVFAKDTFNITRE